MALQSDWDDPETAAFAGMTPDDAEFMVQTKKFVNVLGV